ncbi:MAG: glycosyltransferase [Planctomycetota bacterium]
MSPPPEPPQQSAASDEDGTQDPGYTLSPRGWATRGVWAVVDQASFAGANFLITIALAAWLSERDFGAFTTAYASFLIIGVFTTAMLTEPMMVFGAKKYRDRLPAYFGQLIGGHLLIATIGCLGLGTAGLLTWINGQPLLGMAMVLLAVTQFSQLLPWMTRNACYIESNPRPAAIAGVIYLALVAGTLLVLNAVDRLSIVSAVLTMFGGSLVVNVFLLAHLRPSLRATLRIKEYGPIARDHWRYGKWATLTGITRYIPEQLPYLAVPLILGLAAGTSPDLETGGALKALMNFSIPLILIGWAASTLVTPMLVRAKHTRRFFKISAVMLATVSGTALLFWPIFGLLGEQIIRLVYSGKYVEHAHLTWLIGLIPIVAGFDAVLHTQLKAAERPDRLFLASVASSVVLVVIGLPLTIWGGLTGAIAAILISYAAQAVTLIVLGTTIILRAALPEAADNFTPKPRPHDLPAMPHQPLVSVVVFNRHDDDTVGQAIRSVLDQTYSRFELIVADNGSAADAGSVLRKVLTKDTRVTLLHPEQHGQGGAWNAAFERSRGDVLCFLDSGDRFEPEKLEIVVQAFTEEPEVGMLQHPLRVVDPSNQALQVIPFLSRLEEGWLAPTVLRRGGRWSYMPTSALSFRREIAQAFFPMDGARYQKNADALLFTVGPLLTRVQVLNQPLARYRIPPRNKEKLNLADRAGVRQQLRSFHNTIAGTNQHLAASGAELPQLESRRHLQYIEALFVLSMLRGARRGWVGRYLALMQLLLTDDMYGGTQKVLAVPTYGLLPLMPRSWRAAWLSRAMGMGRVKGLAQALLQLTRLKPRRSPDTPPRNGPYDPSDLRPEPTA